MENDNIEKKEQDKSIEKELLTISSSPHILNSDKTRNIMWIVSICLFPAAFYGIFVFGFHAGLVVVSSIITALITEAFCLFLRKRRISLDDGSAFLTGLLIGLNMPPNIPLYIPIISSIFGIGVVKQAFGGLGNNWANPAIAARVFALFAWTKHMTTWTPPFGVDTLTTATPLGAVKSAINDPAFIKTASQSIDFSSIDAFIKTFFSGPMEIMNKALDTNFTYFDLFIGNKGGCIGEVSIMLLLLGALYLIIRRIVTLDIPVSFLLTVIIISFIFGGLQFGKGYFQGDFLFQILTGGLMLGAFFMATDMVTTPVTVNGRIVFGIGCGIITMLIRMIGGLPEGVSLSILFMNMLTPTIDRYIKIKPMGYIKSNN